MDSSAGRGTGSDGKAPPDSGDAGPATPRPIRAWSAQSSSESTSTNSDPPPKRSAEQIVSRTRSCDHADVDAIDGTGYLRCRGCGLLLKPA